MFYDLHIESSDENGVNMSERGINSFEDFRYHIRYDAMIGFLKGIQEFGVQESNLNQTHSPELDAAAETLIGALERIAYLWT